MRRTTAFDFSQSGIEAATAQKLCHPVQLHEAQLLSTCGSKAESVIFLGAAAEAMGDFARSLKQHGYGLKEMSQPEIAGHSDRIFRTAQRAYAVSRAGK